jgi:multidrug efflux system membrane fusion protein
MATIIPPEVPTPAPSAKIEREPTPRPLPVAAPQPLTNPMLRYALYTALAVGLYFAYPYLVTGYDIFIAGRKEEAKKGPPPAIPVGTATARRGEMDLYLTGLGTVTSLKTVTLRSRVDGELVKVLFNEGDLVDEGQLLVQIDPRPYKIVLEQAEAQKLRDEATLANAVAIQNRNLNLIKSNAIARQDLDTQATVIKELEALVKTDQAKVDDALLNVKFCDIKAPCSGRIGLRNIDQGNMIRANEPQGLAVITQLTPITVVFAIPQDSINRVQKQLNAGKTLTVDAYDRSLKNKLDSGTLLAIDNQVDSTTGTVRLKARFDNKEQLLYPNQFVNVRLLLDTRRDTILVPSAAVQTGPQSEFVYIVNNDKTVALRPVKTGPTEGDATAIESGLDAGDLVVVDGIDKLKPGSKVNTEKAKEKANPGKPGEGKTPPSAAKEAA